MSHHVSVAVAPISFCSSQQPSQRSSEVTQPPPSVIILPSPATVIDPQTFFDCFFWQIFKKPVTLLPSFSLSHPLSVLPSLSPSSALSPPPSPLGLHQRKDLMPFVSLFLQVMTACVESWAIKVALPLCSALKSIDIYSYATRVSCCRCHVADGPSGENANHLRVRHGNAAPRWRWLVFWSMLLLCHKNKRCHWCVCLHFMTDSFLPPEEILGGTLCFLRYRSLISDLRTHQIQHLLEKRCCSSSPHDKLHSKKYGNGWEVVLNITQALEVTSSVTWLHTGDSDWPQIRNHTLNRWAILHIPHCPIISFTVKYPIKRSSPAWDFWGTAMMAVVGPLSASDVCLLSSADLFHRPITYCDLHPLGSHLLII